MMVMPANQTNELVHLWQGRYGGLGHPYTPARTERPRLHLPYVLDNGAYSAFVKQLPFDEVAFLSHVDRYAHKPHRPLWLAVPDVVADGPATLKNWDAWVPRLIEFHLTLALVVQDGMSVVDVRAIAPQVIFVGGSTEWKWATVATWANNFPRVHVGRANAPDKLPYLSRLGVESCDGSGWFRGKAPQVIGLGRFLAVQAGMDPLLAEREARFSRYEVRDARVLPMEVA